MVHVPIRILHTHTHTSTSAEYSIRVSDSRLYYATQRQNNIFSVVVKKNTGKKIPYLPGRKIP